MPSNYSESKTIKTKRIKKKKWDDQETNKLISFVDKFGDNWNMISKKMKNRSKKQCMQKYDNYINVKKKGYWTKQEDQLLTDWVTKNGPKKWNLCSKELNGRCGKQCRERWKNYLNNSNVNTKWTKQEAELFFQLLLKNGASWVQISKQLKTRSENSVKNYFYSSIRSFQKNGLFNFLNLFLKNKPRLLVPGNMN